MNSIAKQMIYLTSKSALIWQTLKSKVHDLKVLQHPGVNTKCLPRTPSPTSKTALRLLCLPSLQKHKRTTWINKLQAFKNLYLATHETTFQKILGGIARLQKGSVCNTLDMSLNSRHLIEIHLGLFLDFRVEEMGS